MKEKADIESKPQAKRRLSFLWWLSIANLIAMICLLVLIFVVSERWWLGVVATYSPRGLCIIPALILLGISIFRKRRLRLSLALINGVALVLVVLVAMEYNLPASVAGDSGAGQEIRLVTCNVNDFEPDFTDVFNEITAGDRDLLVFQEAYSDAPDLLTKHVEDWHVVSLGQYWIASRFSIELAGRCLSPEFNHLSAIALKVDAPDSPFVLIALHTSTARFGIRHLRPAKFASGEAISGINEHQKNRKTEMARVADFVKNLNQNQAVVVAGDFNTPESSKLFQDSWSDHVDAFSARALGYGYTAPCLGTPVEGWPWARVDHILVDSSWTVTACETGSSNGSDHRFVSATIRHN